MMLEESKEFHYNRIHTSKLPVIQPILITRFNIFHLHEPHLIFDKKFGIQQILSFSAVYYYEGHVS
jgi:hypothetical protein